MNQRDAAQSTRYINMYKFGTAQLLRDIGQLNFFFFFPLISFARFIFICHLFMLMFYVYFLTFFLTGIIYNYYYTLFPLFFYGFITFF